MLPLTPYMVANKREVNWQNQQWSPYTHSHKIKRESDTGCPCKVHTYMYICVYILWVYYRYETAGKKAVKSQHGHHLKVLNIIHASESSQGYTIYHMKYLETMVKMAEVCFRLSRDGFMSTALNARCLLEYSSQKQMKNPSIRRGNIGMVLKGETRLCMFP